ncbi:MAG: catalase, partial [Xanthobacteraceae bacterium]
MSKSPELGASERPQSPQYWREIYQGGSPKAEQILFEKLATEIMDVQLKNKSKSGSASIDRTFHAKSLLGVTNAKLHVLGDIPNRFRVGYFQPESEYRATVRISNASGTRQADYHMDMRGAAIRVHASKTESHDLLMTNFPFTHARNAQQFVAFAKAKANSGDAKFQLAVRLVLSVGPSEALRMLRNVKEATEQPIKSAALASYWSRGAILWGEAGPVRYLLRPAVADT